MAKSTKAAQAELPIILFATQDEWAAWLEENVESGGIDQGTELIVRLPLASLADSVTELSQTPIVTRDVPPLAVVTGNPARVRRQFHSVDELRAYAASRPPAERRP